jgi:aryl-alcohol dehydrogenase-like predicted oxidoreductase
MEALTEVVRQGKARYIGCSEWTAEQIRASLEIPGVERFVSNQPQYSMLYREPEKEVFALCEREGIGQVVWSPLAQGVLTGKYTPGSPPPDDSRAASDSMGQMMGRWRDDDVLEAVQALKPIAAEAGLTMAQLALAWVLRLPVVTSAIIGATKPEQVDDNAAASGVKLSDEMLAAIDEALAPLL